MVTKFNVNKQRAALVTEIIVALGILAIAMLPLSLGFLHDIKMCRACYFQGLALEIIDGEMEALAAGEWKSFSTGAQAYPVRAESATNLPPGRFQLTRQEQRLRLEWLPQGRGQGGPVVREINLKAESGGAK